jgi:hypothetical protein
MLAIAGAFLESLDIAWLCLDYVQGNLLSGKTRAMLAIAGAFLESLDIAWVWDAPPIVEKALLCYNSCCSESLYVCAAPAESTIRRQASLS